MKPFLNDFIWEVDILSVIKDQSTSDAEFFLVCGVSFVNSSDTIIHDLPENVIIIPQSLISDLYKLETVDYNIINNNHIPILKQYNNKWYIDLKYYDSFMQSVSSK